MSLIVYLYMEIVAMDKTKYYVQIWWPQHTRDHNLVNLI